VTVGHPSPRLAVAAGIAVLALLAWQGHHLAHWLPQFEQAIESLGPWGPVMFLIAVLVFEPFLVPDPLFGLAAGAAFGLVAGSAYYLGAVYVMCLLVQWLGSRWLKERVLRSLESRERLRALVRLAPQGGARLAFLVRLVPVNQALVSYALGAAGVTLRACLAGNLGMFPHMLPTVYFGAAAVHMTRMAATGHADWEVEGILLMLGLAACAVLALRLTKRAWAVLDAAERAADRAPEPG
jgi:uncharacterized membrane protein YdjX (TVP38/TMEM64 family)